MFVPWLFRPCFMRQVFMEVSSRRLAIAQHRHLPAHGLLSLFSLLRAFLLNVIKRNLGCTVLLFYSEFCHKMSEGAKGQKRTAHGGKECTWTRPFARPRPSSTSDEGGSAVPNSRLITAVIWISKTPMGDAGPLGSTQTTTTATAMRQKTRPPRNQTRAEWEMEWKARRG